MKTFLEYKNLIMSVIVLLLFAACFSPSNETTEEQPGVQYSEVIEQKNLD